MSVEVPAVRGREALDGLVVRFQGIGRHVLLLPGSDVGQTTIPGAMPETYSSKDHLGNDTTKGGALTAFSPLITDSVIHLALAMNKPGVGGGSGPDASYIGPGEIRQDLMSADPPALEAAESTVFIVGSAGWEESDTQVALDRGLGWPLRYTWMGKGEIALLGIAEVNIHDLQLPIRSEPDPPNAHYAKPA